MKSKQSLNIKNKDRDINTSSSGKDTQSKKQHANWSPKMATCWNSINFDINFEINHKAKMPHTLWLSKSLISLKLLCIGWKVEFTLSPPFIKLQKQISISLIIVSDPDGSHMEYEQLMDERCKAKKIKGKEKQHPFYNNFDPHNDTPLPKLLPNLFYQTSQWTPLSLWILFLTFPWTPLFLEIY